MHRYEVVFSAKVYGGGWDDQPRGSFRGLVRARVLARRIGDRHPHLRVTRYTVHDRRSTVSVVDRRTGKEVWEHPGVLVPSVAEVGVW